MYPIALQWNCSHDGGGGDWHIDAAGCGQSAGDCVGFVEPFGGFVGPLTAIVALSSSVVGVDPV